MLARSEKLPVIVFDKLNIFGPFRELFDNSRRVNVKVLLVLNCVLKNKNPPSHSHLII